MRNNETIDSSDLSVPIYQIGAVTFSNREQSEALWCFTPPFSLRVDQCAPCWFPYASSVGTVYRCLERRILSLFCSVQKQRHGTAAVGGHRACRSDRGDRLCCGSNSDSCTYIARLIGPLTVLHISVRRCVVWVCSPNGVAPAIRSSRWKNEFVAMLLRRRSGRAIVPGTMNTCAISIFDLFIHCCCVGWVNRSVVCVLRRAGVWHASCYHCYEYLTNSSAVERSPEV